MGSSNMYWWVFFIYILLFSYLISLCFQPLPETVALVEDIVVEYVTDMVNVFIPRLVKINS